MVSRIIDILIVLVTSFFITGVVSGFTDNDIIIGISFLGSIVIWILALKWFKKSKYYEELKKEEDSNKSNQENIKSTESIPAKKELVKPEIRIPELLETPEKELAAKYSGGYISKVKSYWSDSDSDPHYHYHDNFLTLYEDGRAVACPLCLPDINKPESYDVLGKWNVVINKSNNPEIELLLKKESSLIYDPYYDIDQEELKDIKYGGYFAKYDDFLKEGYYKGIIENGKIKIHYQEFQKIMVKED